MTYHRKKKNPVKKKKKKETPKVSLSTINRESKNKWKLRNITIKPNSRNNVWPPCYIYVPPPNLKPAHVKNWSKFSTKTFPQRVIGGLGWSEQAPGGTLRGTFVPKHKKHVPLWNTNKYFYK